MINVLLNRISKAVETETAASELWQGIEKVEGRRDDSVETAGNFRFVDCLDWQGNHGQSCSFNSIIVIYVMMFFVVLKRQNI